MEESILKTVKKILNISLDDDSFDLDVITHINSVLATLFQLGIGPEEGFLIEDDSEEWADLIDDDAKLNQVRTYVCLKVKMVFDPPATSYLVTALEGQAKELEWRINTHREETGWTDPDPPTEEEEEEVEV